MTTDLDLDALAALEQAATAGPWRSDSYDIVADVGDGRPRVVAEAFYDGVNMRQHRADAALIAALRNAAPALIAAARERDSVDRERAAQENFIADLRARRSHMEAERDAARAEVAALRERVEAVLARPGPHARDCAIRDAVDVACSCWRGQIADAIGGDR